MSKKRLVLLLAALVLIVATFFVARRILPERGSAGSLTVSGNIEVTDARLGFRISGYLKERLVDEGMTVKAGQVLARLEDTDQRLQVRQAEASLAYAEAQLRELEAGTRRQEIAAAAADLEKARAAEKAADAELALSRADALRYSGLIKENAVSRQLYEEAETRLTTAENALNQARATVKSARENLDLKREGPRREEIDRARAQVRLAEESLALARQQLDYTTLTAPFDGTVLSKTAEPGEYLTVGSPVVTLADLDPLWLRAYINETDLGRIKLGQAARVRTDTFPDKSFAGRVGFISSEAEFTPKTVQTQEERVKLMYRIKIDLPNPDRLLKPGMPADASIRLEP